MVDNTKMPHKNSPSAYFLLLKMVFKNLRYFSKGFSFCNLFGKEENYMEMRFFCICEMYQNTHLFIYKCKIKILFADSNNQFF